MMRVTVDEVWTRIRRHAGQVFHQKRGKQFTYEVYGGAIQLHTTNRHIPRSDIARALDHVPFPSTTIVNQLGVQGPSYVYAILMDPRIRSSDW
jgi:hypothetical protein